ncbi:5978_t:CDS:2 [Funneliformis mosseae]|uniref:5978_t:CDS:1 n=1 Tax=Funneliformis mosseae TaxID=27381 RepID=A0A9N9FS98_FUNMO|nr:5978_t:CDS:2 [Funneliformis mosseae]
MSIAFYYLAKISFKVHCFRFPEFRRKGVNRKLYKLKFVTSIFNELYIDLVKYYLTSSDDKSKSKETKETLEIKLEPQITKETRVIEPQIAEETREINLESQIVREGIKSETQITKDTQEIISVSQIIKGSQEVKLESQMTKSSMTEVNEKVEEASIDSKIISNQHIELITKWIDHVDTANIYVSLFRPYYVWRS